MELLAEMLQKGLAPFAIAYSAVVSACEKAKQPHKAMELLAEIQQKVLRPNVISYATAISA